MFYPEASPWRKETLREQNQTTRNSYQKSQVLTSSRVYEKMWTVDVSASIGASILGGLVKVTGSASYLNDLVVQDNEVKLPIDSQIFGQYIQVNIRGLIRLLNEMDIGIKANKHYNETNTYTSSSSWSDLLVSVLCLHPF